MALVNVPCIKHGGLDNILFCQDFQSTLKTYKWADNYSGLSKTW